MPVDEKSSFTSTIQIQWATMETLIFLALLGAAGLLNDQSASVNPLCKFAWYTWETVTTIEYGLYTQEA